MVKYKIVGNVVYCYGETWGINIILNHEPSKEEAVSICKEVEEKAREWLMSSEIADYE